MSKIRGEEDAVDSDAIGNCFRGRLILLLR